MIISGKYSFQFFSFLHSTVCFKPDCHRLLTKCNMSFLQFSVTPASLCRHRSLKSLHRHLINTVFRHQITGQIPYGLFSGWFPQRMKIQAVKNQMQISPLHLYRCIVKPAEHLLRIPIQTNTVRSGTFPSFRYFHSGSKSAPLITGSFICRRSRVSFKTSVASCSFLSLISTYFPSHYL